MEIHIGNRVADVTLVSKEDNKVRLNVDGRIYDVDIAMAENGSCSILHDGNSYNTEVIRGEGGKSYDVNLFYRSYHVDIADTQVKYLRITVLVAVTRPAEFIEITFQQQAQKS